MAEVSLLTSFLLMPLMSARTLKNCSVLDRNVCTVVVLNGLVRNVLCLLHKPGDKVGLRFFSGVIPPSILVVHHWPAAFLKICIAYSGRCGDALLVLRGCLKRVAGQGLAIE